MLASRELPGPSLLPLMRYRDVGAAVVWLCDTFGFVKQVAVSDPDGAVFYAQLTYGNSMIMLGSVQDSDLDVVMRQPDEVDGIETQSCYLVIEDADAHYAKAKAAGAEIVLELKNDGYGRRGYSCRDPQGHIWNFGTYNPWRGSRAPASVQPWAVRGPGQRPRPATIAGILCALLITGAAAAWWLDAGALRQLTSLSLGPETEGTTESALRNDLSNARAARKSAEFSAEAARRELIDQRAARAASESTAENLKRELTEARAAKDSAVRAAASAEAGLASERQARRVLEQELRAAREQASLSSRPQAPPIETSATGPDTTKSAAEAPWTTASETKVPQDQLAEQEPGKQELRLTRKKPVKTLAPKRLPPTYITGLSEVPWPYSTWYRK